MGNSYKLKNMDTCLLSILYAIYIFKTNLSVREIYFVENLLNKYQKKFPYASYLLVVSNTDSKYCVRRKIIFKKERGRPVTVVIGRKINTHIHLAIMGDGNKSAYKFVKALIKELKKHGIGCMAISKGMHIHSKHFINYMLKQANTVRKSNKFNDLLEKMEVKKCYL